ncbi:hypothetical protein CSC36_6096, partial [Pseudomonas aeruginosa]
MTTPNCQMSSDYNCHGKQRTNSVLCNVVPAATDRRVLQPPAAWVNNFTE